MIESGMRGDYEKNNMKLSHSHANALLFITE
jgi:hypothetical protein